MVNMAKNRRKRQAQPIQSKSSSTKKVWVIAVLIGMLTLAVASALVMSKGGNEARSPQPATAPPSAAAPAITPPALAVPTPAQPTPPGAAAMETMEVARAVMVTQELDFGPKVPTIGEALKDIERRYVPDDGVGRTFAILDAYGEPTPDGKLHISMHVSSEKPGVGSIVFKRTGQVLWQSRINPSSTPPKPKSLIVYIDNGKGTDQIVDGSTMPSSILDARLRDLNMPVRDFWPEGEERQVTFIYSACGCPVKVMARRQGERTVRTKDMPVIFPDDPEAVSTISRLMRW
jgi:hypothetical protein